jgi:hypothetical protein
VNLFDLWIVVAVCFLLAALGSKASPEARADASDFERLPHHRIAVEKLSGKGARLGIAYRLENGEVVYVPESDAAR